MTKAVTVLLLLATAGHAYGCPQFSQLPSFWERVAAFPESATSPLTLHMVVRFNAMYRNDLHVPAHRLWATYRPFGPIPGTENVKPAPWTKSEENSLNKRLAPHIEKSKSDRTTQKSLPANLLKEEFSIFLDAYNAIGTHGKQQNWSAQKVAAERARLKEVADSLLAEASEYMESFLIHEAPSALRRNVGKSLAKAAVAWADLNGIEYSKTEVPGWGQGIVFTPGEGNAAAKFARMVEARTPSGSDKKFRVLFVPEGLFSTGQTSPSLDDHAVCVSPHFLLAKGPEPMHTAKQLALLRHAELQRKDLPTPYRINFMHGSKLPDGYQFNQGDVLAMSLSTGTAWYGNQVGLFDAAKSDESRKVVTLKTSEYALRQSERNPHIQAAARHSINLAESLLSSFADADSDTSNWNLNVEVRKFHNLELRISDPLRPNVRMAVIPKTFGEIPGLGLDEAGGMREMYFLTGRDLREIYEPLVPLFGSKAGDQVELNDAQKEALVRLLRSLKRDSLIVEGLAKRFQEENEDVITAANRALRAPTPENYSELQNAMRAVESPPFDRLTLQPPRVAKVAPTEPHVSPHSLVGIEAPPTLKSLRDDLQKARDKVPGAKDRNVVLARVGTDAVSGYLSKLKIASDDHGPDNLGADLKATDPKTKKVLHIELKAVSDNYDMISMTENELRFARENKDQWALAVVRVDEQGHSRIYFFRDIDLREVPPGQKRPFLLSDLVEDTPAFSVEEYFRRP